MSARAATTRPPRHDPVQMAVLSMYAREAENEVIGKYLFHPGNFKALLELFEEFSSQLHALGPDPKRLKARCPDGTYPCNRGMCCVPRAKPC